MSNMWCQLFPVTNNNSTKTLENHMLSVDQYDKFKKTLCQTLIFKTSHQSCSMDKLLSPILKQTLEWKNNVFFFLLLIYFIGRNRNRGEDTSSLRELSYKNDVVLCN